MIEDLIKYIASNIRHRFTRSFLTILSILIGIMAIFVLISYGEGLKNYMDEMGEEMGTDKLIASPIGFGMAGTGDIYFTKDDIDFIKKQRGVSETSGMMMKQTEVKIDKRKLGKWVFIAGVSTDPSERKLVEEAFAGFGIFKGRALKKGDENKVTVGYNYLIADKIFSKPLKLGDNIFNKDKPLEIIGFYEEIGNAADDANVYMTIDAMKEVFDMGDEYGFIYIRADKGINPTELADRLEEKLRKKKDQKEGEEDFFIQSFEQLMETFGTVLLVLNSILVIIAGISVVVAAVNIMNTMYTAVLERTKEIGIMKSIGARNSSIFIMFFMESGLLGTVGGIIGILLGVFLATGLSAIGRAALGSDLIGAHFSFLLIFGALFFSFSVGAFFGVLPAYRASRLNPVDSIRYSK